MKVYTHNAPHHVDELISLGLLTYVSNKLSMNLDINYVSRESTDINKGLVLDFAPVFNSNEIPNRTNYLSGVDKKVIVLDHHVVNTETCTFKLLIEFLGDHGLLPTSMYGFLTATDGMASAVNDMDHGTKYDSDSIFKPLVNLVPVNTLVEAFTTLFTQMEEHLNNANQLSCPSSSSKCVTTNLRVPPQKYFDYYSSGKCLFFIPDLLHTYIVISRGYENFPDIELVEGSLYGYDWKVFSPGFHSLKAFVDDKLSFDIDAFLKNLIIKEVN